jgi:hypothetical protein
MAVWRYVPRGRMRHAVRTPRDLSSVCGLVNPWSADDWRGTGSQAEYEALAALRDCKACAKKAGPFNPASPDGSP